MNDMNHNGRLHMPLMTQTASPFNEPEAPQTTWLTRAQDFLGLTATPLNRTKLRNLQYMVENEMTTLGRVSLDHCLAIVFIEALLHNIEVATANTERRPLNKEAQYKAALFNQFNNREGRIT